MSDLFSIQVQITYLDELPVHGQPLPALLGVSLSSSLLSTQPSDGLSARWSPVGPLEEELVASTLPSLQVVGGWVVQVSKLM